jgi:hypothetical protein
MIFLRWTAASAGGKMSSCSIKLPALEGVYQWANLACSIVNSKVIELATKEEAVASVLRLAGRLESVVRLRPPSFAARAEAWKFVLEAK